MRPFTISTVALALPLAARAATYTMKTNSSGTSFFDAWNFVEGVDGPLATNNSGNVLWQSQAEAARQNLTYINAAGNAIMRVDNTTVPTDPLTYGRNSTIIMSKDTITKGSLVVFDALHMPYGCSVWPALWTVNRDVAWPSGGEIDIIEAVNLMTTSKFSLHTATGCTHPAADAETGAVETTNCDGLADQNSGCLVREVQPNAFGAGFGQNGGGAYALLWNDDGISMWFFPRASVPTDMSSTSPSPAGWGVPSAFFPESDCPTDTFFKPQTIILDIDLCGSYAIGVYAATGCTGNCLDLIKDPTMYNNAYFEIQYLRVFTQDDPTATANPTGSATATGSGALAGTTSGATLLPTATPAGSPGSSSLSYSVSMTWAVGVLVAGLFGAASAGAMLA